jgi:hypothetical protein
VSSAARCPILAYVVTSALCEGWFFGLVGGWDANVVWYGIGCRLRLSG